MKFVTVGRIAVDLDGAGRSASRGNGGRPTAEHLGTAGQRGMVAIGFAGIGFVIARRQPRNPIGWLPALVYVLRSQP